MKIIEIQDMNGEVYHPRTNVSGVTDSRGNKIETWRFKIVSPQDFGAKGDGTTDDTKSIKDMITYLETNLPKKNVHGDILSDYSQVRLDFRGNYKVGETIIFRNAYNLVLNGLNLLGFSKSNIYFLLELAGVLRNTVITNFMLDGGEYYSDGLKLTGNTLALRITDGVIRKFKNYGIFGENKAHETVIKGCKINQYEWSESTTGLTGVGIDLGSQRYDNHFSDNVINYCGGNLINVKSSSNFFMNNHFYGSKVVVTGAYNFFNQCYFDYTQIDTMPYVHVKNCFFLTESRTPFIILDSTKGDSWAWAISSFLGNTFKFDGGGDFLENVFIGRGTNFTSIADINIYDNIHINTTPIAKKADRVYNPNPWHPQ